MAVMFFLLVFLAVVSAVGAVLVIQRQHSSCVWGVSWSFIATHPPYDEVVLAWLSFSALVPVSSR